MESWPSCAYTTQLPLVPSIVLHDGSAVHLARAFAALHHPLPSPKTLKWEKPKKPNFVERAGAGRTNGHSNGGKTEAGAYLGAALTAPTSQMTHQLTDRPRSPPPRNSLTLPAHFQDFRRAFRKISIEGTVPRCNGFRSRAHVHATRVHGARRGATHLGWRRARPKRAPCRRRHRNQCHTQRGVQHEQRPWRRVNRWPQLVRGLHG